MKGNGFYTKISNTVYCQYSKYKIGKRQLINTTHVIKSAGKLEKSKLFYTISKVHLTEPESNLKFYFLG